MKAISEALTFSYLFLSFRLLCELLTVMMSDRNDLIEKCCLASTQAHSMLDVAMRKIPR